MTYDRFHYWITHNPKITSFSTWLLDEKESGFQLTDTSTTPNYHQTIAAMANGTSSTYCNCVVYYYTYHIWLEMLEGQSFEGLRFLLNFGTYLKEKDAVGNSSFIC